MPANIFPKTFSPKLPSKITRISPFCSFASFSIVSLSDYNIKHKTGDLTILICPISAFEIINVVVPEPKMFHFWVPDLIFFGEYLQLPLMQLLLILRV